MKNLSRIKIMQNGRTVNYVWNGTLMIPETSKANCPECQFPTLPNELVCYGCDSVLLNDPLPSGFYPAAVIWFLFTTVLVNAENPFALIAAAISLALIGLTIHHRIIARRLRKKAEEIRLSRITAHHHGNPLSLQIWRYEVDAFIQRASSTDPLPHGYEGVRGVNLWYNQLLMTREEIDANPFSTASRNTDLHQLHTALINYAKRGK